ncbi:MAG: hypothetical protein ACKV0T_29115 [Planctomycetales bacterium]
MRDALRGGVESEVDWEKERLKEVIGPKLQEWARDELRQRKLGEELVGPTVVRMFKAIVRGVGQGLESQDLVAWAQKTARRGNDIELLTLLGACRNLGKVSVEEYQEKFEKLASVLVPKLKTRFPTNSGLREEPDDLIQKTLLKLHRYLPATGHDRDLIGLVFTVARSVLRDQERLENRRPEAQWNDAAVEAQENTAPADRGLADAPPEALVKNEDVSILMKHVDELPEAEREFVILKHKEELTTDQVMTIMGLTADQYADLSESTLEKLRILSGMQEAGKTLPDLQRRVVFLREVQELLYPEIEAETKLDRKSVKRHLKEGMAIINQVLPPKPRANRASEDDLLVALVRKEGGSILANHIGELATDEREFVRLRYCENATKDKIKEVMDMNEDRYNGLHRRSRTKFRCVIGISMAKDRMSDLQRHILSLRRIKKWSVSRIQADTGLTKYAVERELAKGEAFIDEVLSKYASSEEKPATE